MSGFNLKRPCEKCPFRTDIPRYLRESRYREIADTLRRGVVFPCHETVDYDDEGIARPYGKRQQFCAGALITMENGKGCVQHQMVRIGIRLGLFDPDSLDMSAPVYGSLDAFEDP